MMALAGIEWGAPQGTEHSKWWKYEQFYFPSRSGVFLLDCSSSICLTC